MFTGIIQEVGRVENIQPHGGGIRLSVIGPKSASELSIDDSVSINGVCQTVIGRKGDAFTVEAVEETLLKTTLGHLSLNSLVNLELAMKLDDRLGGHLVLGHVDGVGTVTSVEKKETSSLFTVEIPAQFLRYVIPSGSIAVDGVSLTIARLSGNLVTVSIIPHTFDNTTFRALTSGMSVNLEFDLIGKYIERFMVVRKQVDVGSDPITPSNLREWGYST
ncbi:MAG: riboflavin synthase [Bacteroidetes bacterium]|nr:riboflavin synthase [Bacteroidota bacterium]MCW5896300.1 riboflavin synthase [Bacteroidota bacterium]